MRKEIEPEGGEEVLRWFPVVGMSLGFLLVLPMAFLCSVFEPSILAFFTVILWAVFTGALHLDGLADSADGLLSHRSRERMLEIMRDSRLGTMGAVALILVLVGKILGLMEINERSELWLLVLVPVWGRLCPLWQMRWIPCARTEGFGQYYWRKDVSVLIPVTLIFTFLGWWAIGHKFILMMLVLMLFQFALCQYIKKRIEGGTGDTLGASVELGELSFLLLMV